MRFRLKKENILDRVERVKRTPYLQAEDVSQIVRSTSKPFENRIHSLSVDGTVLLGSLHLVSSWTPLHQQKAEPAVLTRTSVGCLGRGLPAQSALGPQCGRAAHHRPTPTKPLPVEAVPNESAVCMAFHRRLAPGYA